VTVLAILQAANPDRPHSPVQAILAGASPDRTPRAGHGGLHKVTFIKNSAHLS
jgi:hypothetical protein